MQILKKQLNLEVWLFVLINKGCTGMEHRIIEFKLIPRNTSKDIKLIKLIALNQ